VRKRNRLHLNKETLRTLGAGDAAEAARVMGGESDTFCEECCSCYTVCQTCDVSCGGNTCWDTCPDFCTGTDTCVAFTCPTGTC
jgi:hypothetical protein